jgi:hypothetical protein
VAARTNACMRCRSPVSAAYPRSPVGRVADVITRTVAAGARSDFFLHGCRHIAESKLAELRVPAHIRDLLFDHVPDRGAGKTYDQHAYVDEMRVAVEKLADYVAQLVRRAWHCYDERLV